MARAAAVERLPRDAQNAGKLSAPAILAFLAWASLINYSPALGPLGSAHRGTTTCAQQHSLRAGRPCTALRVPARTHRPFPSSSDCYLVRAIRMHAFH